MRTKKKVDLKRLAAALPDFPFAYLITVDDGYRAHTVTVEPTLRELPEGPDGPRAIVDVGPIGGRTRENLARRRDVTLLWPPREPGIPNSGFFKGQRTLIGSTPGTGEPALPVLPD